MTPIAEVRPYRDQSDALARLDWGHPLLTPEGEEIRGPKYAFEPLRKLGVLKGNKAQLLPGVYLLLDPAFAQLTDGLAHLLGRDCSGPAWCSCFCEECKTKRLAQKRGE